MTIECNNHDNIKWEQLFYMNIKNNYILILWTH